MVRFEEYAARKTAQAVRAALQPFIVDTDRAAGVLEPIGNEWSRRVFGGDFYLSPSPGPARPACSLVFVESSDGNTDADDPFTLGGGLTDKHVIYEGLSQVAADAVLAGAGTIADSEIVFSVWHPELVSLRTSLGKPRHPVQIVATLRGLDLNRCLLFNVPEIPVVVLTVAAGERLMRDGLAARPWVRSIVMSGTGDLPAAFATLRTFGIERISAVGGRHLATGLVDAHLVQDLYLTISPKPGGEPGTPLYPRPLKTSILLRSHGTGSDLGVVFAHLRIEQT